MAGVFDKWDRVKKIGVVFKELDDSEIVIIMAESQGQIWGRGGRKEGEIESKN